MAFTDPNRILIARTIVTDVAPNKRIEINGTTVPNGIAFFTGLAAEAVPGKIEPVGSGNVMYINFKSPEAVGFPFQSAQLQLETLDNGTTVAETDADSIRNFASGDIVLGSPTVTIGDSTSGLDLEVSDDGSGFATIKNNIETWHGTATTPLLNGWVDTAGSRFGYYKDATGRVSIRGQIRSGTSATIVTLPVGYRPSSNLDFMLRQVGGVIVCAVSVNTAGTLTVSANVGTAQGSGINLDVISYPSN